MRRFCRGGLNRSLVAPPRHPARLRPLKRNHGSEIFQIDRFEHRVITRDDRARVGQVKYFVMVEIGQIDFERPAEHIFGARERPGNLLRETQLNFSPDVERRQNQSEDIRVGLRRRVSQVEGFSGRPWGFRQQSKGFCNRIHRRQFRPG